MLKRSIDLDDPFDLSLVEKIYLHAKRLCVVCAIAALALDGIDLLNAHALGNAADYARRQPHLLSADHLGQRQGHADLFARELATNGGRQ